MIDFNKIDEQVIMLLRDISIYWEARKEGNYQGQLLQAMVIRDLGANIGDIFDDET